MDYFTADDEADIEALDPAQRRTLAVAICAWMWDLVQRHDIYRGQSAELIEETLEAVSTGTCQRIREARNEVLELIKPLFRTGDPFSLWLVSWLYTLLDISGCSLSRNSETNAIATDLDWLGNNSVLYVRLRKDEFSHVVHVFIEEAKVTRV